MPSQSGTLKNHLPAKWPPLKQAIATWIDRAVLSAVPQLGLAMFLLTVGVAFLIAGPLMLNKDYDKGAPSPDPHQIVTLWQESRSLCSDRSQ